MVRKIAVSGARFFMKFRELSYFEERAKEANAVIHPVHHEDDDAFRAEVRDASSIIVIARRVGAGTIRELERCEIILALSVGFDCIDVHAATARRIPVCNVPSYCTDEVANHAMTLLLAVSRKISLFDSELKKGLWDYNIGKPIYNFRGRTLGIIGLGRIGRAVIGKAKGFGMGVIGYDPYVDDDIFQRLDVGRRYDLGDLLSEADYITVHAPLTGETFRMMDKRAFSRMKEGAIIVNTARGEIMDEEALYRALKEKRIGGAGLDVLVNEPGRPDNPLFTLDNALVTPHVAWYSEDSFRRSMVDTMDEIVRVLKGQRPRFIVNPEVLWKGRE